MKSNLNYYILNDQGEPVLVKSCIEWAEWFEHHNRIVAQTEIGTDVCVSTVFLGLNYRFLDEGPPILWETKVFGGKHEGDQMRCSGSREQAEAMHAKMVKLVNKDK